VNVVSLDKLERKMTLTLPVAVIQNEVDQRRRRLPAPSRWTAFARQGADDVVAQRYGYSVHYEVMNDKVGEAFAVAANEAKLRVAGQPRITERDVAPTGEMAFDAVFESIRRQLGDLATRGRARQRRGDDAAIDKTLDILASSAAPSRCARTPKARTKRRVTVDFEGKIDGERSTAARPRTSSSWSATARC